MNLTVIVVYKSCATSKRQSREQTEMQSRERSRAERRAEQRDETRREKSRGAKAQRCRGAKAKTGRVSCDERERNTSRNAGEKRHYIGSARACGARGDCSHEHTRRDAHIASLITPLTGATHARN